MIGRSPICGVEPVRCSGKSTLAKLGLSGKRGLPDLRRCLGIKGRRGAGLVLRLGTLGDGGHRAGTIRRVLTAIGGVKLRDHVRCVAFSLRTVGRFVHLTPTNAPMFCLGNRLSPGRLGRLKTANLSCRVKIVGGRPR